MPACCEAKHRRLAYVDSCKSTGEPEYETGETVETDLKKCRSLVLDRWRPGGTVSSPQRDRGSLQTEQATGPQQFPREKAMWWGSCQSCPVARRRRTSTETVKAEESGARRQLPKGCSAMNVARWMWEPGVAPRGYWFVRL